MSLSLFLLMCFFGPFVVPYESSVVVRIGQNAVKRFRALGFTALAVVFMCIATPHKL